MSWYEHAPNPISRDAIRYWPIVQTVASGKRGILFSQEIGSGEPVSVILGRASVDGRDLGTLTGSCVGYRARWVDESGASAPWGVRPGEGWRSHVQVLFRSDRSGRIAILTGKGLAGGTLLDLITALTDAAKVAARETGRPWSIHAWSFRVKAGEPQPAGKGSAVFVPYTFELADTIEEMYAGNAAYVENLSERETGGIVEWEAEWKR